VKEKTLSRLIGAVEPSQTLAITSRAKALRARGKDVIGFGAGEPDFDTPDFIKDAAKRALDGGFTKYTPPAGMPELRTVIAEKLKRDNRLSYEPEQVVVSCGAKHALYNVVRVLCNPGDEFIIIAPYWVTYPAQVIMSGGKPVYVATTAENGYKLDVSAIARLVNERTKAIILNSPSNPTGWVATEEELRALADLAVRNDLIVISDEIYEKIIYRPAVHMSIASLGDEIKARTIVVNGLSKSHSMTGWRIGYCAAPLPVAKLISRLQSHCTSNPTSIAQAAALEALRGDEREVTAMVEQFRARRDFLMERMRSIEGLRCYEPAGAFYVFPDISSLGKGSVEFSEGLLEDALVAVVPGEAFGCDGNIRISYATSMENLREGMDRIEAYVKDMRR
jgi:aspartate aminotransferase